MSFVLLISDAVGGEVPTCYNVKNGEGEDVSHALHLSVGVRAPFAIFDTARLQMGYLSGIILDV